MHEVSLIQSLFAEVQRALGPHPGAEVHALHVRVGELAGVEPSLFQSAYDVFRGAGGLAEAELVVLTEPAVWACPRCGLELARGEPLVCGDCELPARLLRGGDVFLDRIEAVVNDV